MFVPQHLAKLTAPAVRALAPTGSRSPTRPDDPTDRRRRTRTTGDALHTASDPTVPAGATRAARR
ncbi:hypothetical protein [Embleya sp. AB8]|uniref:hypothetical protein n=1 Tax=Embleya sp. AB8 TaxID=3156304 RepID=UPI003C738050